MIDNATNWRPIPISCSDPTQTVSGNTNYTVGNFTYSYGDTGSNTGYSYLPNDADCAYYILPNYGLIIYANSNYSGTIQLNVLNTNIRPVVFAPVQNGQASSWRVYYYNGTNTVELN